jgi:hypothetical protein
MHTVIRIRIKKKAPAETGASLGLKHALAARRRLSCQRDRSRVQLSFSTKIERRSANTLEFASQETAKPPALGDANGFAFVPHTRRLLGRHSSGCRTGKHGVPRLQGTLSPTGKSISPCGRN